MSEPKNPLGLDQQLCFSVYAAAHAFTAAYKPLLDPLGLTYPQYLALVVLWERDGMMVKEIAADCTSIPGLSARSSSAWRGEVSSVASARRRTSGSFG